MLRSFAAYEYEQIGFDLGFQYQDKTDPKLVHLRQHFNLDDVAGTESEVQQMINLMQWVHSILPWDGQIMPPHARNILDLIEFSKTEKCGVNCRMMATALNEVYLSMGFKSRVLTCLPMGEEFSDCHVVTMVYSQTWNKWIYMDPSHNAYFKDEHGNYLNIEEFRDALIRNRKVYVNDEVNEQGHPWDKEEYISYMAKNAFRFVCGAKSEFNQEAVDKDLVMYYLHPLNYRPFGEVRSREVNGRTIQGHYISNPDFFWSLP